MTLSPSPWLKEARALSRLALPLALTHLAYMAIMTTDVVMMGHLGAEAIAAGTLGRDFYWVLATFAFGTVAGATPVIAQHLGARRFRQVRPAVRNAAWLAVLLALPVGLAAWHADPLLRLMGQDPAVTLQSQEYLRWLLWGLVPTLWFAILTEFLAAHERPRAVLVVTLAAIGLNALLDWALMFGNLGAPAMGLAGAGLASVIVNAAMFAALLGFVLADRRLRRYHLLGRLWRAERAGMAEIARLGMPIAGAELADMGLFFLTTLMMGLLGVTALAAHAVTGQCYAIVFMIPVGLMQAGAVRVGRAAGRRDPAGVSRAGWTATAMAGLVVLLPALVFWTAGTWVAGLILDAGDPVSRDALGLAGVLLAIAAVFMIGDAVQIVVRGALQGLKDTAVPMAIALATSGGLGLPAAALMGFALGLGGPGIWAGMAFAVAGAACLLLNRFRRQSRGFAAAVAAR